MLDGYEQEQRPVAIEGSGEMAEAARKYMAQQRGAVTEDTAVTWATAYNRTLLSVRLDVDGVGDWSMVATSAEPPAVRAGDRAPDLVAAESDRPGHDPRPVPGLVRRAVLHRRTAASGHPGERLAGVEALRRLPVGRTARLRPA